jgi:hypothetical protein
MFSFSPRPISSRLSAVALKDGPVSVTVPYLGRDGFKSVTKQIGRLRAWGLGTAVNALHAKALYVNDMSESMGV